MQTSFSLAALADPKMKESEAILRACVHCGFCTATCPTYVLLGDELDSPRGRIYLIKDMLEGGKPASRDVVTHVDRCLSCLSCMTTCPSGVHYMHLVDHARAHIEETYRRPLADRALRALIARVLPYPTRMRAMLAFVPLGRRLMPLLRRLPGGNRLEAMLALAPAAQVAAAPATPEPVGGPVRARVAILKGCAQSVLAPHINAAAARLLARHGVAVIDVPDEGCCGALPHHMGREHDALALARAAIDAWTRAIERDGIEAILVTTSGCGTTIKDYGFMLRDDRAWAEKAARIAAMTKDITEYVASLDLAPPVVTTGQRVAYHSACSLQHGQKITATPKALLKQLGFVVKDPAEAHLCCGSAGTYNMLQPEIAARLRSRKAAHLEATNADLIAAGNLGCMTQIGLATALPIVHTVELIDWATGGPLPAALGKSPAFRAPAPVG